MSTVQTIPSNSNQFQPLPSIGKRTLKNITFGRMAKDNLTNDTVNRRMVLSREQMRRSEIEFWEFGNAITRGSSHRDGVHSVDREQRRCGSKNTTKKRGPTIAEGWISYLWINEWYSSTLLVGCGLILWSCCCCSNKGQWRKANEDPSLHWFSREVAWKRPDFEIQNSDPRGSLPLELWSANSSRAEYRRSHELTEDI